MLIVTEIYALETTSDAPSQHIATATDTIHNLKVRPHIKYIAF